MAPSSAYSSAYARDRPRSALKEWRDRRVRNSRSSSSRRSLRSRSSIVSAILLLLPGTAAASRPRSEADGEQSGATVCRAVQSDRAILPVSSGWVSARAEVSATAPPARVVARGLAQGLNPCARLTLTWLPGRCQSGWQSAPLPGKGTNSGMDSGRLPCSQRMALGRAATRGSRRSSWSAARQSTDSHRP